MSALATRARRRARRLSLGLAVLGLFLLTGASSSNLKLAMAAVLAGFGCMAIGISWYQAVSD